MSKKNQFRVSDHNYAEDVLAGFNLPERVSIDDSTIRKIDYGTGVRVSIADKLEIADKLDEVGVAECIINFPTDPEIFTLCKEISAQDYRFALATVNSDGGVGKFTLEMKDEIDKAIDGGADVVVRSISRSLLASVLKSDEMEKIGQVIGEECQYVQDRGGLCSYSFGDFTRANYETFIGLVNLALKNNIRKIRLTDSAGAISPEGMKYLIRKIRSDAVRDSSTSLHIHNTLGLASAVVIAGVTAGVNHPNLAVNGLADFGFAALEEVAVALEALYNVRTGIRLEKLHELSNLVQEKTGIKVPPYKAIVGENAFVHAPRAYLMAALRGKPLTPISAETVGQKERRMGGKDVLRDTTAFEEKLKQLRLRYRDEDLLEIRDIMKERLSELQRYPYWLDEETIDGIRKRVVS